MYGVRMMQDSFWFYCLCGKCRSKFIRDLETLVIRVANKFAPTFQLFDTLLLKCS